MVILGRANFHHWAAKPFRRYGRRVVFVLRSGMSNTHVTPKGRRIKTNSCAHLSGVDVADSVVSIEIVLSAGNTKAKGFEVGRDEVLSGGFH